MYATSVEDPTLELFACNLGLIVLLCSNLKLLVLVIAVIALHPIGFEDTAAKAQWFISQLNQSPRGMLSSTDGLWPVQGATAALQCYKL